MTDSAIESLRQKMRGISLGVYSADLGSLRSAAEEIAGWGANILHFDVMDGVFVPAMTAGPGFVKALDVGLLRDVHLMVDNPALHVESHVCAGADLVTVHAEATDVDEAMRAIRKSAGKVGRPVLAGLGVMPGTPLSEIERLLPQQPDLILVLSLDPRHGTKPDIPAACARLQTIRDRCSHTPLMVFDGGVTLDSIHEIAACKPDMIVSGSAVLRAKVPQNAYREMVKSL